MDTEGFEDWYRHEHAKLVNTLFLVAGTQDAAREATDEAFARAAMRWSRVRAMQYPNAWTYRVALNVLRKTARRDSREMSLAATMAESISKAPPIADPEVWDAVRALPPPSAYGHRAALCRRLTPKTQQPLSSA